MTLMLRTRTTETEFSPGHGILSDFKTQFLFVLCTLFL